MHLIITIFLQGILQHFDDIVMCAGTAGTCGAVAVANYLTGSKIKYVYVYLHIHTSVLQSVHD